MGSQVKDAFSSKVSLNMATNVARTVVMAVVGLLMVPYYIDEFGLSAYAIIPLATSVTNYFIIISDSLSNAFTRYMVVAIQKDDMPGANRVFTTSVIGMGGCMIVLLPIVALLAVLSPYIFNIGPSSAMDVQVMFLLIMVASLIISFSASLGSVYMAYNKMYITYISRAVQTISQVALVIALFTVDVPSLSQIGLSYIVSSLLMLAIMVVYLRRVCPSLEVSRGLYDRSLIREMGALGFWSTVAEIGNLLFIQASLIVVNVILGSEAQGTFSIAANVIMMVHTACTAISVSAVPLAYRCYVNGDSSGMVDTLRIFSKFVGIVMVFPLAYLIVFMPSVLEMWLGPGYSEVYPLLYVMLPAEVAICSVSALMQVPVVYKRMRIVAAITCAVGAFNVLLSVIRLETTDLGMVGVCIAWVISMLVLKLVFYPVICDRLAGGGLKNYYFPIVSCYAVFALLLAVLHIISQYYVPSATWTAVILTFMIGFCVFLLPALRFFFNRKERSTIVTYLPGFMQRFIGS